MAFGISISIGGRLISNSALSSRPFMTGRERGMEAESVIVVFITTSGGVNGGRYNFPRSTLKSL